MFLILIESFDGRSKISGGDEHNSLINVVSGLSLFSGIGLSAMKFAFSAAVDLENSTFSPFLRSFAGK